MIEPTTEAGKWLQEQEPYLTTWAWGFMGAPIITAIEAEALAAERARLAGLVQEINHPCHDVCVGDLHADCQCAAWIREQVMVLLVGRPR